MRAGIIYLIAGFATGWQLLRLLLWGLWGRPVHGIELLAFLAALVLVITALVTFWKREATSLVALIACLSIWVFYVPSLYETAYLGVGNLSLIETVSIPGGHGKVTNYMDILRIVVPPLLLFLATAQSFVLVKARNK